MPTVNCAARQVACEELALAAPEKRPTFTFEAIGGAHDQFEVRLRDAAGPRLGDICEDDEARGCWMARPAGDDAFTPGFKGRRTAALWLLDRRAACAGGIKMLAVVAS